jgi:hypothetical protein
VAILAAGSKGGVVVALIVAVATASAVAGHANYAAAKFLAIPAAVGSNDGFAATASFVAAKVVEARVAASFVANVALVVAVPLASCVGTIAAAFAASGHFV